MKKIIMAVMAILITNNTFADTQTSGLSKNVDRLKALATAFKHHSTTPAKIDPNDLTMGYAGQDLSTGASRIIFL